MCGIAGIINYNSVEACDKVSKMIDVLEHRGPDDQRIVSLKGAVLGFARLAIIDLDSRSMQPFRSECGRYTIVFNGEIYNYIELKNILKNKINFKTEGDAEVLLNAYILWGEKCVNKINGMYAFCIYDNIKEEAILCRDRFGQKPLFYFLQNKKLLFASEIKCFRKAGMSLTSNIDTWNKYLRMGVYDDSEYTFFNNIKQVKPGQIIRFKGGILESYLYYDIEQISSKQGRYRINSKQTQEDLFNLLCDSIKIHTRTDVPYSIALSGGFDSSALVSLINAEKIKKPASCFTLDFENHEKESIWAKKAAAYFNTQTIVTDINIDDMINNFENDIYYQESPLGGLMNMGQALNFKKIKHKNYTVVLDGAGVDEIFCGYKSFHQKYLVDNLHGDNFDKLLLEYCSFWKEDVASMKNQLNIKKNRMRTEIDGTFSSNNQFIQNLPEITNFKYTHKTLLEMQLDYLKYFKLNRGLRMKDRSSMQHSVELRVPFIDHRIVEFALSLHEDCYFKEGRSKSIIRDVFQGKMNENVRIADKRSINAPQGAWLRSKKGRRFVESIINSNSFKNRGIFNVKKIKNVYNNYCDVPTHNSFFIWQWINFELWHRVFIDKVG